jgi:hypothetical protein
MIYKLMPLISVISMLACDSPNQSRGTETKSLNFSTNDCTEDLLNSLCTAEYAPVVCNYQGKKKTYSSDGTNSCLAIESLRFDACKDNEELDEKQVTCSPKLDLE